MPSTSHQAHLDDLLAEGACLEAGGGPGLGGQGASRRCTARQGVAQGFANTCLLPPAQKVPQTSVAPTYKLTLPSEFVVSNLSHLVDQSFELVDKEGAGSWKVALLPRRWRLAPPCATMRHACTAMHATTGTPVTCMLRWC